MKLNQEFDCFKEYQNFIECNYNIKALSLLENTSKTKLIECSTGSNYILKSTKDNVIDKFNYLGDLGLTNIIYPELNINNNYVTDYKDTKYYIAPFYQTQSIVNEKKTIDLFGELSILHDYTKFPRQLTPRNSRYKFDELTKQLDYKFKLLEEYIRSLETNYITKETMFILSKYYRILDAKKELVRLQRRIILNIKDHESVDYVFIHNNPKLEHLLYVKGAKYLISLDNGKVGINSLDFAKFYVENENINVDIQKIIINNLQSSDSDFYYDYFRYLVLLIYIKRININSNFYQMMVEFELAYNSIEKYFYNFIDKIVEEENNNIE